MPGTCKQGNLFLKENPLGGWNLTGSSCGGDRVGAGAGDRVCKGRLPQESPGGEKLSPPLSQSLPALGHSIGLHKREAGPCICVQRGWGPCTLFKEVGKNLYRYLQEVEWCSILLATQCLLGDVCTHCQVGLSKRQTGWKHVHSYGPLPTPEAGKAGPVQTSAPSSSPGTSPARERPPEGIRPSCPSHRCPAYRRDAVNFCQIGLSPAGIPLNSQRPVYKAPLPLVLGEPSF